MQNTIGESWTELIWLMAAPLVFLGASYLYRWLYREQSGLWTGQPGENTSNELLAGISDVSVADQTEAEQLRRELAAQRPFYLPEVVSRIFSHYPQTWCVAGGWALDLHLERKIREHEDIEIAVLRRDQDLLWEHLIGWQPHFVVPGADDEPQAWEKGVRLELPVHEIHTRPPQSGINELEILLNEADGDQWIYRRDPRITRPLSKTVLTGSLGIPYLAPEIVLLYKSKEPKPKDEQDFHIALPAFTTDQLAWLGQVLQQVDPSHPWLAELNGHS
jgi:hypothetical protein